jgi:hypothetical protein
VTADELDLTSDEEEADWSGVVEEDDKVEGLVCSETVLCEALLDNLGFLALLSLDNSAAGNQKLVM